MAREMKDSGIEWIGEIPAEWSVERGKNILQILERPVREDDGIITCFRDGEVTLRSKRREEGFTMSDKEIGYQGIEVGDLVVHGMDGFAGAIGVSDSRGKATPVLNVMDSSQEKRFLMYYLRCAAYCGLFLSLSTGIRVRSCDTNWNKLKNIFYILPSVGEQQRIVNFIDDECAHIDSVIDQTRASIEEYKKLKQAVITQAVTKGIRPDRQMKDSGNKWLSAIPVDWKLSRVGLHFDITLGKMLCSEQPSDEYTLESYFCAANVHFDGVSNDDLKQMWFSPAEKEQYLVTVGDLLVVEGGAGAGGCAVVTELSKAIYIQNSIMIVRSRKNANVRYLKYLLEFLVNEGYIDIVCNKATIPHFTKDKLANVPFAVSDEQEEIAHFLDKKTADIDALVLKKESIIQQLEQYKKSLIYEYVTGKKEVLA